MHLMQSMSAPSKTKEWAAIELYLIKVLCWRLLLAAFGLADCPAVSFRFYTAGGGNPLYCEELLKQGSSVKNKAIGLISFAELESCMHKVDKEAKK